MTADAKVSKPRWWPMFVILGGAIIWIAWARTGSGQDRQQANMDSTEIGALAFLLLLIWWLAFSRVRFWRRIQGFLLLVVCVFGFLELFRFRGFDGDLVPIFEWANRAEVQAVMPTGPVKSLPGLADSPQFFGPDRDGTLTDPGLITDWKAEAPVELWRRPIGLGWSGFSVVGDNAITQEQRGEEEVVLCLDLATGVERWSHADKARYSHFTAGDGPRATPMLHNGLVFSYGSTGILNCLELATGKLAWTEDTLGANEAVQPEWGAACSPLIVGDLVVLSVGGAAGRSLIAYQQRTGKRVWSGGDAPTHWSSPVLMTLAGRRQILIFNQEVIGHDATDGTVLWTYPWRTMHPHISLPMAVGPDTVLIASGYGTGCHLVKVSAQPDGKFLATEVWRSNRLKSKFANIVSRDGFAYGLDDGILTCVDLATGKRRWKRGRYGHGQLLLVGVNLLVMAEQGDVVLVRANPEAHDELARMPVFEDKTWNPPALAGRYLLVRNDREAACFRLPVKK